MDEKVIFNQIYQYAYPVNGPQPQKESLGNKVKSERVCIFCNRGMDDVAFKKEAHIVPAALGNKSLFNYDECDECNEAIFSIHENELLNYLQLERIMIRGKPRKGAPKYKPVNTNSYITSTPGTNTVTLLLDEKEEVFEVIDQGSNIMTLKCNNLPPYSLAGVCKSLLHMGWSILPQERRKDFPFIYNWIKGDIKLLPLYLDVVFIPGGGMANVILEIWESESDYPLLFRLTYGHRVLSFYLPKNMSIKDAPSNIAYPINVPSDVPMDINRLTIRSEERIKPNDCTFNISYLRKETP